VKTFRLENPANDTPIPQEIPGLHDHQGHRTFAFGAIKNCGGYGVSKCRFTVAKLGYDTIRAFAMLCFVRMIAIIQLW
jgi:hypothetical protein